MDWSIVINCDAQFGAHCVSDYCIKSTGNGICSSHLWVLITKNSSEISQNGRVRRKVMAERKCKLGHVYFQCLSHSPMRLLSGAICSSKAVIIQTYTFRPVTLPSSLWGQGGVQCHVRGSNHRSCDQYNGQDDCLLPSAVYRMECCCSGFALVSI